MSGAMKQLINHVATGASLSIEQAKDAFDLMMTGEATPVQISAFLMALRVRGETVEEITGGALTMRDKMTRISGPANAIDVVGTGGDDTGTYNISTASALVVAGAGVPVAKHGNKAASSKSGAADVLSALGIKLDAEFSLVERSLNEAGICFMFAQRHHSAMKHVGPTRVELGTRTVFNLLGPISNPAGVRRYLVGVFDHAWIEPLARVLANLGTERAWVVHGADGMDELSTTGTSYVAELVDGEVRTFEVNPGDAGLETAALEDLLGGDGEYNAAAIRALLDGEQGAFRDIVLYNAGAALTVAGEVSGIRDGAAAAALAIDSGAAREKLDALVRISNEEA